MEICVRERETNQKQQNISFYQLTNRNNYLTLDNRTNCVGIKSTVNNNARQVKDIGQKQKHVTINYLFQCNGLRNGA